MVTGQFPNYEAVLPKDNHRSVVVDREELATAIRRVSLLADDKSRSIQLLLDNNKLDIRSSNSTSERPETNWIRIIPRERSRSDLTASTFWSFWQLPRIPP